MEMILLSENKLKISLTKSDMILFDFPMERESIEELKSSKAFRTLLETAKIKTGFNASEGQLFVSLYKTNSGCDVYITKLQQGKSKHEKESIKYEIYKFSTTKELICASLALHSLGYKGTSTSYWEKTNSGYIYYLVLQHKDSKLYPYCVASEFCKNPQTCAECKFLYHINEYCTVICEKNSVEVLAKVADCVL